MHKLGIIIVIIIVIRRDKWKQDIKGSAWRITLGCGFKGTGNVLKTRYNMCES